MNAFVATLDTADLWKIGLLAAVVAYLVAWVLNLNGAKSAEVRRLERRVNTLKAHLDHLVTQFGVTLPPGPPSGLSPEVERLAREPYGKIAAIKLLREQNPGVGLAEAKARIEEFLDNQP